MFSVITDINNKKTKVPTLMELFTATWKPKNVFFFWQLEMFDVWTTGDTAHIDTIFKFLPHNRIVHNDVLFTDLINVTLATPICKLPDDGRIPKHVVVVLI